jgi:hypothetical protein
MYAKMTQTVESGPMAGVDVMMASRRGGSGFDYYTLTYDDPDEQYEEDSIPGKKDIKISPFLGFWLSLASSSPCLGNTLVVVEKQKMLSGSKVNSM